MKFPKAMRAIVLLPLLTAGCVTVRENYLADGSLAVEIQDNGWYIFDLIPIVTGNPDGRWPHWFTDDVALEKSMHVLDRIVAREKPEKIGTLVTRIEDEDILFVINRVSMHTSAVIPPSSKSDQ